MKALIDPKDWDLVLAQWRGADAKVWVFHVTLKRMALMLFREGDAEVIYIVAAGCEHMSGPFSWKEAHVSILVGPPDEWGEIHHRVMDKEAGFHLSCSGVAIARGPGSVPSNPFEKFFGDVL